MAELVCVGVGKRVGGEVRSGHGGGVGYGEGVAGR